MGYNVSDLYFAVLCSGTQITCVVQPGAKILSENKNRKAFYIFNDSPAAGYIKLGASGSSADFTFMMPGYSYYESYVPCPTSQIWGCWTSGTGSVQVTEVE